MQAYPNPVTDKVTVKLSEAAGEQGTIEVLDYTGKMLSSQPVTGNSAEIDMSGYAAGMYLVRYSDNTVKHTIKINKQ
jgi:hypothetical protein